MSKPIEIDLRRDLPKVREQYDALIGKLGRCSYTAPCAVGAMLSPEQRTLLKCRKLDTISIATLIESGAVAAPDGQVDDLWALQSAFDGGDADYFKRALARLEAKYLTGEVG